MLYVHDNCMVSKQNAPYNFHSDSNYTKVAILPHADRYSLGLGEVSQLLE